MTETKTTIIALPKTNTLLRKAKKTVVVGTVAAAALVLIYAGAKKVSGKAVDVELVDA
jgi:hypothetical protein